MDLKEFKEALQELGIFLTETQCRQFSSYYHLLVTWNEKMNLTGITEEKEVYLKHFYDSATLCRQTDFSKIETLCDIGTGAGFPGLVLKILFPSLSVTLVDSLQKRTLFLQTVIKKLELNGIEVLHARAEEYSQIVRERFDIVTSRAVAPLSTLMEYSIPLLKVGGIFMPMKGHCEEEIEKTQNACKFLHLHILEKDMFLLPKEESTRTILKYKKEKKTSSKYPRKFGEMKKKPL